MNHNDQDWEQEQEIDEVPGVEQKEISREIVIGIHSIRYVLMNPQRRVLRIVATEKCLREVKDAYPETKKIFEKHSISIVDSQKWFEIFDRTLRDNDFAPVKISFQVFIEVEAISAIQIPDFLRRLDAEKNRPVRILALDQVTDIQNGAAIMRTAAFYGIDYLILPLRGSFGLTPSFYRISSGASEVVNIVRVPNLSRMVTKLTQKNILCLGLNEDGKDHPHIDEIQKSEAKGILLVLGSEDKGISPAVKRVIPHLISFTPVGSFKTLNVSSAAAIALEKYANILEKKS